MERQDKPDPRKEQILPVVRYSATRKAQRSADYWDYATLARALAVLASNPDDAQDQLGEATAITPRPKAWELESTKRNLGLIREAREARKEEAEWIRAIEDELQRAADAVRPAEKPT